MSAPDTRRASDAALIAAAPMLFVVFWGSGFPITKFGLEYIEPFTLLAIRSASFLAMAAASSSVKVGLLPNFSGRCKGVRVATS